MLVKIIPNEKSHPPGKLADAELHFEYGPDLAAVVQTPRNRVEDPTVQMSLDRAIEAIASLAGLKLVGFGIWEHRRGGDRTVTFPSRQFSVNGERRSFSLVRTIGDEAARDRLRDLVLRAYGEYESSEARTAGIDGTGT